MNTKLYLLAALVIVGFGSIGSIAWALDDLSPTVSRDRLEQSIQSNFKTDIVHIPRDLRTKNADILKKVDDKIAASDINPRMISAARSLDVEYYYKEIAIGVLPYIQDKKEKEEVSALANDLSVRLYDRAAIRRFNQEKLQSNDPQPTAQTPVASSDAVHISLNGSGYNVTKAVAYARQWTQNGQQLRNASYNYFAGMNDCTNFVSQVLRDSNAGNISSVRTDTWGYDYDDAPNWYYANSFNNPPSWTWGGAHNFYYHLRDYSANVRRVFSTSDLRVGDIVQWDLEPNDGVFHIGHSTVVTKIENGKIYVTYHTTDKEDEPIATLFNAKYLAYAWAINH